MAKKYHQMGKREGELIEMASSIEDAAYLLEGGEYVLYAANAGKSSTCQCRSSRSAGGTCRASSLETGVLSE